MKRLSMVLWVVALSLTSCGTEQAGMPKPAPDVEIGAGGEVMPSLEPPEYAEEDWNRWLLGEWEASAESDLGGFKNWIKGTGRMKVEQGIGGQFLIMRLEGQVVGISPEYMEHLRQAEHASEADIEDLRTMPFEHLEIRTTDPETGALIGYLFDSWRCVAEGTGCCESDRETMRWEWSVGGQGTSVRTTEKVGEDRLTVTEKYTLPDGTIMEDRVQMMRKR